MLFLQAWRKRFFRLRSSKILEYYKSEDGDLKGVINLEDCKSVNSDLFHKKYKYVFDIETHDRVYYLVATSSEEMTEWVDTLCNVCGFTLKSELIKLFFESIDLLMCCHYYLISFYIIIHSCVFWAHF